LFRTYRFRSTTALRESGRAAEVVKQRVARPDNDPLLKLLAAYKQAAVGDLQQAQPGFWDFFGTAKHALGRRATWRIRTRRHAPDIDLVQQLRA
jgi:acyl-CoA-binding protein